MRVGWCDHCQNTGYLDCHCGGDFCVCERNGEYPCPHCDVAGYGCVEDDYEDGLESGPPAANK